MSLSTLNTVAIATTITNANTDTIYAMAQTSKPDTTVTATTSAATSLSTKPHSSSAQLSTTSYNTTSKIVTNASSTSTSTSATTSNTTPRPPTSIGVGISATSTVLPATSFTTTVTTMNTATNISTATNSLTTRDATVLHEKSSKITSNKAQDSTIIPIIATDSTSSTTSHTPTTSNTTTISNVISTLHANITASTTNTTTTTIPAKTSNSSTLRNTNKQNTASTYTKTDITIQHEHTQITNTAAPLISATTSLPTTLNTTSSTIRTDIVTSAATLSATIADATSDKASPTTKLNSTLSTTTSTRLNITSDTPPSTAKTSTTTFSETLSPSSSIIQNRTSTVNVMTSAPTYVSDNTMTLASRIAKSDKSLLTTSTMFVATTISSETPRHSATKPTIEDGSEDYSSTGVLEPDKITLNITDARTDNSVGLSSSTNSDHLTASTIATTTTTQSQRDATTDDIESSSKTNLNDTNPLTTKTRNVSHSTPFKCANFNCETSLNSGTTTSNSSSSSSPPIISPSPSSSSATTDSPKISSSEATDDILRSTTTWKRTSVPVDDISTTPSSTTSTEQREHSNSSLFHFNLSSTSSSTAQHLTRDHNSTGVISSSTVNNLSASTSNVFFTEFMTSSPSKSGTTNSETLRSSLASTTKYFGTILSPLTTSSSSSLSPSPSLPINIVTSSKTATTATSSSIMSASSRETSISGTSAELLTVLTSTTGLSTSFLSAENSDTSTKTSTTDESQIRSSPLSSSSLPSTTTTTSMLLSNSVNNVSTNYAHTSTSSYSTIFVSLSSPQVDVHKTTSSSDLLTGNTSLRTKSLSTVQPENFSSLRMNTSSSSSSSPSSSPYTKFVGTTTSIHSTPTIPLETATLQDSVASTTKFWTTETPKHPTTDATNDAATHLTTQPEAHPVTHTTAPPSTASNLTGSLTTSDAMETHEAVTSSSAFNHSTTTFNEATISMIDSTTTNNDIHQWSSQALNISTGYSKETSATSDSQSQRETTPTTTISTTRPTKSSSAFQLWTAPQFINTTSTTTNVITSALTTTNVATSASFHFTSTPPMTSSSDGTTEETTLIDAIESTEPTTVQKTALSTTTIPGTSTTKTSETTLSTIKTPRKTSTSASISETTSISSTIKIPESTSSTPKTPKTTLTSETPGTPSAITEASETTSPTTGTTPLSFLTNATVAILVTTTKINFETSNPHPIFSTFATKINLVPTTSLKSDRTITTTKITDVETTSSSSITSGEVATSILKRTPPRYTTTRFPTLSTGYTTRPQNDSISATNSSTTSSTTTTTISPSPTDKPPPMATHSSTVAKTTSLNAGEVITRFPFRLKITNMAYDDELLNVTSPMAIDLSTKIHRAFMEVVKGYPNVHIENSTRGITFSRGSIISQFIISMNGSNNQFLPYEPGFLESFIDYFKNELNLTLEVSFFYTCHDEPVIEYCPKKSNNHAGMIIGIVVALFVAVVLLIVIIIITRRKRLRGEGHPQSEEQGVFGSTVSPYTSPGSLTMGSMGGTLVWRGNDTIRSLDSNDSGSVGSQFQVENLHRNRRSLGDIFQGSDMLDHPGAFFTVHDSSVRTHEAGDAVERSVNRMAKELNRDLNKKRKKKNVTTSYSINNNNNNNINNISSNIGGEGSNRSQGGLSSVSSNSTSIQITKGSFIKRLKIFRNMGATGRISEHDTSSSAASYFLPPEPQPYQMDFGGSSVLHRNPIFSSMPDNRTRLEFIVDEESSQDTEGFSRRLSLASQSSTLTSAVGGHGFDGQHQGRIRTKRSNLTNINIPGRYLKKGFRNQSDRDRRRFGESLEGGVELRGSELQGGSGGGLSGERSQNELEETSFVERTANIDINDNNNNNNSLVELDNSEEQLNRGVSASEVNAEDVFELKDLLGLAVSRKGRMKQTNLHRSDLSRCQVNILSAPDIKCLRTTIIRKMERLRKILSRQSDA